jgi:DNA-binding CsgD family transcriptional regulator
MDTMNTGDPPRSLALGGDWPLTGRDQEWNRLARLAQSAAASSVILAGPEGVGKTRLAREYVLLAGKAGRATQWISATRSAATVAFGALSAFVDADQAGSRSVCARPHEVARSLLTALDRHDGVGAPTLVVDDAHLLDGASITLVHHLVAIGRCSVVATVRSGDQTPELVTALWKNGLATRIDLDPLDEASIHELFTRALGGQVDPGTVAQLAGRSKGNLLYVRELVLGAVKGGELAKEDGVWRLFRPLVPSERLVELIETKLAGLSADERNVLEHIAYGEPLDPSEVAALGEPALVATLELKGFVHSRMSSRGGLEIRLARPLDGDVLRLRMPAMRRAAVARSLAEATEATSDSLDDDNSLRIAVWRLEAGGASPEQLLSAAWSARWRYDFPLARRLVKGAIASGGGFDARLLGAQLTAFDGDPDQSEEELAQLGRSTTDNEQRAKAAIARARNLMFWLGRPADGLQVVSDALAMVDDPRWRDELMACRAGLLIDSPAATVKAAEPLLGRTHGPAPVYASLAASFGLCRGGRLTDALAVEERGHAAHAALAEPMDGYRWLHLFAKCEALSASGRLIEAESLARQQYQDGLNEGSTEHRAFFAYELARTVLARGCIAEAIEHARQAAVLFRDLRRHYWARTMQVELALALGLSANAEGAREALDAIDGPPMSWASVDLLMARGWTAVATGQLPNARRLMDEAATCGNELGDLVGAAEALHGLARIGYPDQAFERLDRLAKVIEGDLIRARLRHVSAMRSSDPNELALVSEQFATMGADLLAAEAASEEGALWIRMGEQRQARAAASRAAEHAARCPGAVTPALGDIDARSQLNVSELETAQLAASGHSNKQIAAALQLSVRTVENRLQLVYQKLGISKRSQLPDALGRRRISSRS